MTAEPSISLLREKYVNAEQVYQRAELCLSQRKYSESMVLLKSGLSLVGYSYYTPNVMDDTGTMLVLAQFEERKGNIEGAAHYLRDVLRSRLELLRERIEASAGQG